MGRLSSGASIDWEDRSGKVGNQGSTVASDETLAFGNHGINLCFHFLTVSVGLLL